MRTTENGEQIAQPGASLEDVLAAAGGSAPFVTGCEIYDDPGEHGWSGYVAVTGGNLSLVFFEGFGTAKEAKAWLKSIGARP